MMETWVYVGNPLPNKCGNSKRPWNHQSPLSLSEDEEEESSYLLQFGWKVVVLIAYRCGFVIPWIVHQAICNCKKIQLVCRDFWGM